MAVLHGWASWGSIACRPEGAAERSKAIAPDIAAPLIAAVVKTTGIVKIETIEPMIANKAAFRAALDALHVLPLNATAA